ncbi:MAG: hypothetical protein ACRBHB_26030 [Arenicella sp.]
MNVKRQTSTAPLEFTTPQDYPLRICMLEINQKQSWPKNKHIPPAKSLANNVEQ